MAVYTYRAWNPAGRRLNGTMQADTPHEARTQLRDQGLRIERFAPAIPKSKSRRSFGLGRRRRDEVTEFARLLALLLRSGLPLPESLEVLSTQSRGRQQTVIRSLNDRCRSGVPFSDALAEHPDGFDNLFLSTVRVGEQAGTLDTALSQLADYLRDRQALAGRITSALIYPLILMVVSMGVVLFLMSYVIPQLLTVLTASGAELPVSTRILMTLSNGLIQGWPWILGALASLALLASIGWHSERGRTLWDRWIIRLPLIGVLLRKILIARFAQQMSVMLATGTPFLEALGTVRRGQHNRLLKKELQCLEDAVAAGSDIAPALHSSKIFPPLVIRLVAVGQESGELTEMLEQLRVGYETEVRVAVEKFTAALEPLLIVLMAGIVGFIVFATLMPILQATKVLS